MGDMQIVCKADEIGLDDAFINLNARALAPAAGCAAYTRRAQPFSILLMSC